MTDYYTILGVAPTATAEEIKKAYRQLALKYQPDRNMGDKNFEKMFQQVTAAYEIVSDPNARLIYDNECNKKKQYSENEKTRNPQKEQLTPKKFHLLIRTIKDEVLIYHKHRVDNSAAFYTLNDLLNDANINYLIASDDIKTNRQIIQDVLKCFKVLIFFNVENILLKLVKLAGTDNQTIKKIYSFSKKIKYWRKCDKYWGYVEEYWKPVIGLGFFLFCILFNLFYKFQPSSNSSETYIKSSNEDLNTTSLYDRSNSRILPYLSFEEKIKVEKDSLISEGWKKEEINNGSLPLCYNFISKKSKLNNYIQVDVGISTDVSIKVMELESQRCVRYVFINSGSTFTINNIPEGKYYLKIAYGKDWYAKVEAKRCIGKFITNPIYKKGDDIMDFNIQTTPQGYNIPSFELKLDIIAANTINAFKSQDIDEKEFNN